MAKAFLPAFANLTPQVCRNICGWMLSMPAARPYLIVESYTWGAENVPDSRVMNNESESAAWR